VVCLPELALLAVREHEMRHPRLGPELPGKGKPEPRTVSLGRVVFDSAAEAEIERLNDELSAKGIELGEALAREYSLSEIVYDALRGSVATDAVSAYIERQGWTVRAHPPISMRARSR